MGNKVVIVDDSRFQLHQVERILKELGLDVTAFLNGNEALKHLEDHQCDCLFTDLLMPEIDGFQLTQAVKERFPGLEIVVLTANIQKTVQQQCIDLGVTHFLNKPVDKAALEGVIGKISSLGGQNEQGVS